MEINNSPLMSKDVVRYITQNITPEQVQYVADVKEVCKQAEECGCDEKQCNDILYVTKIMAFSDKFRTLHWAAESMSLHKCIDEFIDEIEEYKDAIAENIQGVIGQFKASDFCKIELPVNDDALCIINELKQCVHNWLKCHTDDVEYEGCRSLTSSFLEEIHKYVYLFRLCRTKKCSELECEKEEIVDKLEKDYNDNGIKWIPMSPGSRYYVMAHTDDDVVEADDEVLVDRNVEE